MVAACNTGNEATIRATLHDTWEFKPSDTTTSWLHAYVPGQVHLDLLQNRLIPDPFKGNHESKLQWVGEKDWVYQKSWIPTPEVVNAEVKKLIFNGLDTYAKVYLNGQLVLEADNAHRTWEVDISAALKKEENLLKVHFLAPERIEKEKERDWGYPLPEMTRGFTRKPAFHYGWDWGPKFVTMGIWRSVQLVAYHNARIVDVYIEQKKLTDTNASLLAHITVEAARDFTGELKVSNQTKEVAFKKGKQTIRIPFFIENPERWWPNGLGEARLYDFEAVLFYKNQRIDSKKRRIGLREVELVQEKDAKGSSFYFKVNGMPVYMKGANYIPLDHFQGRVVDNYYQSVIQDVKEAHMNMLRVWGGGIYEEDIFYDLCDENGILVWQDFMFANNMFPGDQAFLENVRAEVEEQVKRLRNHPSIALWCGNNEIAEAWERWGWKDNYTEIQQNRLWQAYDTIFHHLLPAAVTGLAPTMPYWPSSPSLGRGDVRSHLQGDMHNWWVWHDRAPFENYETLVPRFMSEFGFQAAPPMKTIRTFAEKEGLDLKSAVMKAHQKHRTGFETIDFYLRKNYGVPKDFTSWVYLSQVQQAAGIRIGIEAMRRAKPYNMGALYWQLNDTWPVISWSGLDYFGQWKALHYEAKDAFAPYLLSFDKKGKQADVYLVNDQLETKQGKVSFHLITYDGDTVESLEKKIEVLPNQSQMILKGLRIPSAQDQAFWVGAFSVSGRIVASNAFYGHWPQALSLPQAEVVASWKKEGDDFLLILTTSRLARYVCVEFPEIDGRLSDNFFDLFPNQKKVIRFSPSEALESIEGKFRVMHLTEAY